MNKRTKKCKYTFTLKNINVNNINTKYNIFTDIINVDNSNIINSINTNTVTDIKNIKSDNSISFLDESKKMVTCKLTMIDLNSSHDVNLLRYNCFWCRHPFESKPIGCPLKYIPNQVVKTYYSHISKDVYSIKENVTLKKLKDFKHQLNGTNEEMMVDCTNNAVINATMNNTNNTTMNNTKLPDKSLDKTSDKTERKGSKKKQSSIQSTSAATETKKSPTDTKITVSEGDIYETDGIFCSFNCCKSFIDDNTHNFMYSNSNYLLLKMYNKILGTQNNVIFPAPHWRILEQYGGNVNIIKFRESFNVIEYEYHGTMRQSQKFISVETLYEENIKF
jgi:hypothetical protein